MMAGFIVRFARPDGAAGRSVPTYCPRRPDFEEVACGLARTGGAALRPAGDVRSALRAACPAGAPNDGTRVFRFFDMIRVDGALNMPTTQVPARQPPSTANVTRTTAVTSFSREDVSFIP